MPPRKSGAKNIKSSAVIGNAWQGCIELPGFVADGVFSYLADRSCESKSGTAVPAAFRGKGGIVAATRLVCKEIQKEVDQRILQWMQELQGLLQQVRRIALMHQQFVNTHNQLTPTSMLDDLKEAKSNLQSYAARLLGDSVASAIAEEVCFAGNVLHLKFNVCTFMCMATQRCQVHGPMGKPCRNVCQPPPVSRQIENFCVLKVGEQKTCLFAREKCLDAACAATGMRFLQGPEHCQALTTARAMFRMRGVYHPFGVEEVRAAANYWGAPEDAPLSEANWPRRLFLERHPALEGDMASIQQFLGLTDAEARLCREEAGRKQAQRVERDRLAKARLVDELVEDLDNHFALSTSVPVDSLAELGRACPGMEAYIRDVIHEMSHARHVLDIGEVINCITSLSFFLGPVIEANRESRSGVASSEAYDYVSAMHFAKYGVAYPMWCVGSASMKTNVLKYDVSQVVRALRFFDELDEDSLCVAESREHDQLPVAWMLTAGKTSIKFPANFRRNYTEYTAMYDCIATLLKKCGSDAQMPKLFPKLSHTYVTTMHMVKKQAKDVTDWVVQAFKVLVGDPATRCAALDLLFMQPWGLLPHLAEASAK